MSGPFHCLPVLLATTPFLIGHTDQMSQVPPGIHWTEPTCRRSPRARHEYLGEQFSSPVLTLQSPGDVSKYAGPAQGN